VEKEQIKQTKHHKQDNDESNINIKDVGISIKTFFSNKRIFNKTTLVILLIIVAMFFSLYFRLYTETLPQTDNWAQNSIENYYKTQIRTKIDAEYPNLPSKNKDELVNKEYLETYKKDRIQIETTKTQISTQFKNNYQDESGQTYLLAIDPYTYYRQTRNLIEKGTVCDEIKDNKCWNNHMMAPLGREMQLNGHVVVQYVTYRISKIFNPNTSLTNAIFILPAIIIMLGIIPAFFITKKYAGIVGGFVAAMLIGLHPYLLGRTPAGFVDTDAYGITIALYLIWLVIAAYSARSYKKKILFAGLAGVTTWIFKQTWGGGWSFTFNILVAILIGMTLYQIIKVYLDLHKVKSKTKHKKLFHSRTIRSNLLILITYLLVTTILLGTSVITAAIKAPASASQFQNAAHSSLWPNVYTTVAELNVQSLPGITNALISNPLGQLMLFIAFLAIPLSLIKTFDKKSWYYLITSAIVYLILISKSVVSKINPNFYIAIILITLLAGILINLSKDQKQRSSILLPSLLTTLLVGCVFASVRGIRFVLLGINPFSIMIGLTIGILFLRLSKGLHKLIDIPKIATKIIVLILALVIIINYINVAHTTALNETPQMNDAWYESLTKIKDQAEEGAILTSWWDFGHWFKAVADRAVTFDGASQNTPMAHWVGKSLTTGNEDMTIGILRMLNCGSNEAFELLDKEINSPALTIDILNEIIIKDKINAKQTLLSKGISETNVNKILIKTHCNPPESYYITSQDMVSKAGVWAHFGLWDFKKADLYLNGKDLDFVSFNEKAEAYDYTKEETEALYDDINFLQNEREANTWISPWPGYVGTSTCSEENNIINCKINIKIGQQNSADIILENYVFDKNKEEGIGIIGIYSGNSKVGNTTSNVKSFTTVIEGKLKTYSASSGEVLDLGIVNINNKAVIGSAEVTNSIFTRLFYFDGAHTEHFEKFSDVVSETTNERIIIWKVNWEGNNNINPLQPVNISIS
jgi:dolichyl-phosphooligosaccharide-protein glycotransferase